MLRGFSRRQLSGGMLFGPLMVGLVYGFLQSFLPELKLNFFYAQSPFVFTALSGVAIAFACRPVLLRVDWTRGVAVGLGVALLCGIGPLGDWIVSMLIVKAGLGAFPLRLPPSGTALLVSAVAAGALMGVLFRPRDGAIDRAQLWARWRFRTWGQRLSRVAGIAAGAVALQLVAAAVDGHFEGSAEGLYVLLVEPNYWLRLQGLWATHEGPGAPAAVAALLVLLWLRALISIVPLLPIALAVRGSWSQLTLVFTVLLFVVGEFAPLMADQPYPSLRWLLLRTALGVTVSAAIGGLMAAVYGVIRRGPGPVPHG